MLFVLFFEGHGEIKRSENSKAKTPPKYSDENTPKKKKKLTSSIRVLRLGLPVSFL